MKYSQVVIHAPSLALGEKLNVIHAVNKPYICFALLLQTRALKTLMYNKITRFFRITFLHSCTQWSCLLKYLSEILIRRPRLQRSRSLNIMLYDGIASRICLHYWFSLGTYSIKSDNLQLNVSHSLNKVSSFVVSIFVPLYNLLIEFRLKPDFAINSVISSIRCSAMSSRILHLITFIFSPP